MQNESKEKNQTANAARSTRRNTKQGGGQGGTGPPRCLDNFANNRRILIDTQ